MRNKQEILRDLMGLNTAVFDEKCKELTLEVLIDIRDLLDESNILTQ